MFILSLQVKNTQMVDLHTFPAFILGACMVMNTFGVELFDVESFNVQSFDIGSFDLWVDRCSAI
jgi:hypothetical protein